MNAAPSVGNSEPVMRSGTINNSWGSLEQSISQAIGGQSSSVNVEPTTGGNFPIGSSRQTFIGNFSTPPIGKQIENLRQILNQSPPSPASNKNSEDVAVAYRESQPSKINLNPEKFIEGVLTPVNAVSTQVNKQSKDVFGALKGLFFEDIGFKYQTKEQQENAKKAEEKKKLQNANKKSFYDALTSARLTLENMILKMINELQERMGVSGKSIEEKNKLLGAKARNFSFTGVNTAYHIKAIHDAMLEQAKNQAAKSKPAPVATGKKKTNFFMDKNSSISRQGQSAYSAAG